MGILETIGRTPHVQLEKSGSILGAKLYAKLEIFNPGGSIKDRTSLSILEEAFSSGKVNISSTIIESSSGNMAIGLAQFCLYHDLDLIIVVDPFALESNIKLIKTYGAKVIVVKKPCPLNGWLGARLNIIKKMMAEAPRMYWPNQYENRMNPEAHYKTMEEFHKGLSIPLDYVFIATSTCGTIMGCCDYIRDNNLKTKVVAVDAKGSVLFGGKQGKRIIPGHGASKPSHLLDKTLIHDVIHVSDLDCVNGCHELLANEAILAGGSSGGVYSAIFEYKSHLKPSDNCGMIICDRGERYMETIYNSSWVTDNLLIKDSIHNAA